MPDTKKLMADLDKAIEEVKRQQGAAKDTSAVVQLLQKELVEAIKPVLAAMVKDITTALKDVKIEVPKFDIPPITVEMPAINVPPMPMPRFDIPTPQVSVTVPEVKVPNVIMPDYHETTLRGVNAKNPVPVMMMGTDGLPLLFPGGGAGQGGGKANFLTIKDILTSLGNSVMDNTNNAIKVSLVSGSASGTQYNDGATPDQAGATGTIVMLFDGGSAQSWGGSSYGIGQVQLSGFDGSLVGITANALDVNLASQNASIQTKQLSGAIDSVEIASVPFAIDVKQVSGSADSVSVITSVEVKQVSGFVNSVEIASQPFTLDIKQVSGSADSVSVITSVEVKQVSGFIDSVLVTGSTGTMMVVGDDLADAADTGGAPVKMGGIARQTNPTAVADGDRVSATYDDVGRHVMRINQVRDLVQTAYVAVSTGTETTLLASSAGVFLDLIYIMGANDSGAAVQVDIRSATGANKVMTLEIPANGTAGVSLPVPLPQDIAAATWTVDLPDITGTNVYISALFSKEV